MVENLTRANTEIPKIHELDWTQKPVNEIRHALASKLKAGYVLQGSQFVLEELTPQESTDSIEYKNRTTTAVFATDQPLVAMCRAAFGAQLQQWRQAVLFQADESIDPATSKGYVYICAASNFRQDALDLSEYLAFKPIYPVEKILISGKELAKFLRTTSEIENDFYNGELSTRNIRPEQVRVADCEIVLYTILTFLERMNYLDYTFNPTSEAGEHQLALLERLTTLIDFYQVILTSESMKSPELKKLISSAIQVCEDRFYGMYEVDDLIVLDKAQTIIATLYNLIK